MLGVSVKTLGTWAGRLVVAVAFLLALATVLGRLASFWLSEPRVNQWLEQRFPGAAVSVQGFEVRWHRFNPVVRVGTLTVGESRVQRLVLKTDWMESLWRWGPVLRHLANDSAQLRFEQTVSGAWVLAGMPSGQGTFDWRTLLEHSDQLLLRAALTFASPVEPSPKLALDIQASNQRARRRWGMQLFDPNCAARCRLNLDIDERIRVPGWQAASLAVTAATVGDGVSIPAALLGGTGLRVARADVRWDASARDWRNYAQTVTNAGNTATQIAARVEVNLALSDITLPGGRPFDFAVSARGSSHPGYALARSFDAVVTQDGESQPLPEFWLRWLPGRLQLYAPKIDLHAALAQAARSRRDDDVLGQWLKALAIEGELSAVQAQRDLTARHWSWQAQLARGAVTGRLGAPTADTLAGELIGYERGLQANIQAPTSTVGFPGVFSDLWPVRDLDAELELHWRTAFLTLLGRRVDAELVQGDASAPHLHGAFRLAVPADQLEQTLALRLDTTQLSMRTIKRFLPSKLNTQLRRWLLTAPKTGWLNEVQFGFMGYVRGQQGPIARRMALRGQLADASVRFDERWPLVTDVAGELEISGQSAALRIDQGSSGGVALGGSQLRIPAGGKRIELALASEFDAAHGLQYLRQSPLAQSLPFVEPDWAALGAMQIDGAVSVPIGQSSAGQSVVAELDIRLLDVDLQIPSLRTRLAGLNGPLQFRSPTLLSGQAVAGSLHGQPLQFDVDSTTDEVVFSVRGASDPGQVYELLGVADPGFAQGTTNYNGSLSFPLTAQAGPAPSLSVETDLRGLTLALPGELGKHSDALRPTQVSAVFAASEQRVQVTQAHLDARLRVAGGSVVDGELRLLGEPVSLNEVHLAAVSDDQNGDQGALVISGQLAELPLAAGAGGSLFGEVPVRIEGLKVGALLAGETNLGAVAVAGRMQGESLDLQVAGEHLAGEVSAKGPDPLVIELAHLQLPDSGEDGAALAELDVRLEAASAGERARVNVSTVTQLADDPLPLALQSQLPAATVTIGALRVGEEDFGSWQFAMAPEPQGVRFTDLQALSKGIAIEAPEVFWHKQPNETQFVGQLHAGNLAKVLPQLGYAPTLETEAAAVQVDLTWPGSPVNLNLLTMQGNVDLQAREGHFIDVESGNNALRIFSLLNFSALAKRMNLDFSDVLGRGISFESLAAEVSLGDGDLRFRSPMEVEGTGSKFRLSGTVDLDTGALANDMVITLPLSKGIPWYAAYVALANPLAGLGVLVGERVLRKPLEQFSSARYRVTGTLDNPKAKLVKVFDNEMTVEPAKKEQATASTEDLTE